MSASDQSKYIWFGFVLNLGSVLFQMDKSNKKLKWRFTRKEFLKFGRAWYVVGSTVELGNWDPNNAIRLKWTEADNWSVQISLPIDKVIHYKYLEGGYENVL